MADITRNITLQRGDSVSIPFIAKYSVAGSPIDLTGKILTATMRRASAAYTDYEFTINITDVVNGEFSIEMTEEYLDGIPASRCIYEIHLNDGGTDTRLYTGIAVVLEEGVVNAPPETYASNQQNTFKDVDSGYSVNWEDNLIVDASLGDFELILPDEPVKGFLFDFIDKGNTFSSLTPVTLRNSTTTIDSVEISGYYVFVWSGNIWASYRGQDSSSVAGVTSVAGRGGDVVLTSTDVGLENVDNTSDAYKPLSDATIDALADKLDVGTTTADITDSIDKRYVTDAVSDILDDLGTAATHDATDFELTGTTAAHAALTVVHGISSFGATLVDDADSSAARNTLGLGSVNNTSDINKPVSTAQAAADAVVLASANTYADGKVVDALGSSTTIAPSQNAVVNGLATKASVVNVDFLLTAVSDEFSSGLVSGGVITPTDAVGGFSLSAGVGYIRDGINPVRRVTWGALTDTATFDGLNSIAITDDNDGVGEIIILPVADTENIYINIGAIQMSQGFTAGYSSVATVQLSDFQFKVSRFAGDGFGALITSGLSVAESTPLRLTMDAGVVNLNLSKFNVPAATTFAKILVSSDYGIIPETVTTPNEVTIGYYNNPTNPAISALIPMTVGYWKKDFVFTTAEGARYYVYAQTQYATEQEARDAAVPSLPDGVTSGVSALVSIVSTTTSTSIADGIIDVRPYMPRIFGTGDSAAPSSVTTLTGDVVGSGAGTIPVLLASVVTATTKGSASKTVTQTIDTKGRTTSLTEQDIAITQSQVSGLTSDLAGKQSALGYTPENVANKQTDLTASATKYPTVDAVNTGLSTNLSAAQSYADGKVIDSIADSDTTHAPSRNAVFDALATKESTITATTSADYYRGDKTFQPLNKAAVGLSNVDNTSDANKPVSTAQATADGVVLTAAQSYTDGKLTATITNGDTTHTPTGDAVFDALALKESIITATTSADYYRGDKTFQPLNKAAVGLSNVDNTSDINKPVSTAQATADGVVLIAAQTYADGKVIDSIADSDTTHAPSRNAVFDALALKLDTSATTANVPDSLNKRYVTDAQLTTLGNTTNINSGDQNLFSTIVVAGQSNVVADNVSDTLTLVAGSNITITTNATTDEITINSTGGGGGSLTTFKDDIDFGNNKYSVEVSVADASATIDDSLLLTLVNGSTMSAEEAVIQEITLACTTVVGVGYTITAYAPLGADGIISFVGLKVGT